MARLKWDEIGKRLYETGISECALYVQNDDGEYGNGVAWSGISKITQSPSGAEATPVYADNIKYLNLVSAEEFSATIEAYMYPDEFDECNGSTEIVKGMNINQQTRKTFGLVYKTIIGNDTAKNDYGYKIHIIYGATAAPSSQDYATVNDNPEASTMSWEIKTTPVNVTGHKPTAKLVIDSTKIDKLALQVLEEKLYGGALSTDYPTLPSPDEIVTLLGGDTILPSYYCTLSMNQTDKIMNDKDALAELIVSKNNSSMLLSRKFTQSILNLSNGRIAFLYPKDYGNLVNIRDGNGFDVTDSFKRYECTVNERLYNLYILKDTASLKSGFIYYE